MTTINHEVADLLQHEGTRRLLPNKLTKSSPWQVTATLNTTNKTHFQ